MSEETAPESTSRLPEMLATRANRIELMATILLAIATVATAWSGYQSSRWSGVQAINFSKANAARVESTRQSSLAGQQTQVDVATFIAWADAYSGGNEMLTDFYFERFRPEFKPAVVAWIATKPLKNPNAPQTPFAMPQYSLAANEQAETLLQEAEAATEEAKVDNQRSDNYVLAVVLFASSLFFAGISTKLDAYRFRAMILGLGYVLFIGTLIWVLTFPISFSV
jgi:hypothetical protein